MIEYQVKINDNGDKFWYMNGKPHREDGPAIEQINGSKIWCKNGKYHREDGPAIEWADGDKEWYLNNKLHREDGPAVEKANGDKYWFLNDKLLSEEEFNKRTNSHTVIIDGKEIVISSESFESMKKFFNKHS